MIIYMKKLILVTVLFVGLINPIYAQKSFYEQVNEPDSIFSVYLEKDTISSYRRVYLVFKNNSSDSIVLKSNFEHFSSFRYSPGIYINFYINHLLGLPNWGDLRPDYFKFSEGQTHVPPKAIIRFPIELPYLGKVKNEVEKGIDFELFYFYYNVTQKQASCFRVKTNYLNLNYLKKYDKEE
ncbi:hypothetical protein FACS189432_08020 [Bacteroidia bacterium]|nr:hypothetical protein FACS189426_14420 [Bacteroidia bacterium]GHT29137.1 hypothetical protein FACS189432_08020 [Bacteroidia bacterium]